MLRHSTRFAALLGLAIILHSSVAAAHRCADRDNNGVVSATDALGILKVSVGTGGACDFCVCDTNGTNSISASDALVALKVAVGQPQLLKCRSCNSGCDASPAPECGGDCDTSLSCVVPSDSSGDSCECRTACEISNVPSCGGSCAGSGVAGDDCAHVHLASGNQTNDICTCLPPDTVACGVSSAPQCGGLCQPGHHCAAHGSKCQCDPFPVPGSCGSSAAPECAGICPDGQICSASGQACECISDINSSNTLCENAIAPACGAPCGNGKVCAKDFTNVCRCRHPCEVSDAPSCGGDCPQDRTCASATAGISGGSTLDFCICQ